MENDIPQPFVNAPVPQSQFTQQSTTPPQGSKTQRKLIIIVICVLILLIISAGGIFAYMVAFNSNNTSEKTENQTITPTPLLTENNSSALKTFSDPNIEGMQFEYDPSIWEVIKLSGNNGDIAGPQDQHTMGVLLKEINGEGSLVLEYMLRVGVGGGIKTFTEQTAPVTVQNNLMRYKYVDETDSYTIYLYGINNTTSDFPTVEFFNLQPERRQLELQNCQESKSDGTFFPLTEEECNELIAGSIIGIINQPTFSWSIKLKRISELGQINPDWENNEYFKSTGADDGYIIINTQYTGDNPEEADKIVSQFATN